MTSGGTAVHEPAGWSQKGRRLTCRAVALSLFVVLGLGFALAAPIAAHSDFDSSVPADGDQLDAPPATVELTFSLEVLAEAGAFEVLLPDGSVVETPTASDDGLVWTLTMPSEIEAGEIAVRYNVIAAADGHVITGGFAFRALAARAPTTTAPPSTTTTPSSTAPSSTGPSASAPSTTTGLSTSAAPRSGGPTTVPPSRAGDEAASSPTVDQVTVEEFLAQDAGSAPVVGFIGRFLSFGAILLAIGLLVAVVRVVFDDAAAIERLLELCSAVGLVLVVGAGLESYGLATEADIGLDTLFGTRPGVSPLIRAGAGVVLAGLGLMAASPLARWGLAVGSGAGVVSLLLDGHTVSEGSRPVHTLVDLVHVAAGGVWFGGLVVLAVLLLRSASPGERAQRLLRFSSVATVAVVPVLVAGLVMGGIIGGPPWSGAGTTWGRLLLAKLALVVAAIGLGAYNHFRLVPQLRGEADGSSRAAAQINRMMAAEAGLLLVAVALTAGLVVASPP